MKKYASACQTSRFLVYYKNINTNGVIEMAHAHVLSLLGE